MMTKNGAQQPKIFGSHTKNWLTTITVAVIFPLLTQNWVAELLTTFSTQPESPDNVQPELLAPQIVAIIFGLLILGYISCVVYQILFLTKTGSHSAVWALIITLFGPLFIWFLLPYLV